MDEPEENGGIRYVPLNRGESLLTDDTLEALNELGDVLRQIHTRLVLEGYTIINGQLKKLDTIKF